MLNHQVKHDSRLYLIPEMTEKSDLKMHVTVILTVLGKIQLR